MGERSSIEWTDATWNPIRARRRDDGRLGFHCEHASEGCRFCYAETLNRRGLPNAGTGLPYKPAHRADVDIVLDEAQLLKPLRWRRPRRIFLGSMTDIFADFVDDALLDQAFAVMALCPQHVFQVLTKRPGRMRAYVSDPVAVRRIYELACDLVVAAASALLPSVVLVAPGVDEALAPAGPRVPLGRWPLPNVWLGTSCEDQATVDARVPELLATPAAMRFVSAEPLLSPIDFRSIAPCLGYSFDVLAGCRHDFGVPMADLPSKLDWIIVGGESGPRARPMHPDWARAIRDQCAAAGVSFHFKQRGAWTWLAPSDGEWPIDEDGFIRLRPDGTRGPNGWPMQRVGKARAGRLLDGVEHNGMPEVRHG